MNQSLSIYLALLSNRFFIVRTEDVKAGEKYHLGVGPVITVYNNGTVVVQGRFKPKYQTWAMQKLVRILPHHTLWHDT